METLERLGREKTIEAIPTQSTSVNGGLAGELKMAWQYEVWMRGMELAAHGSQGNLSQLAEDWILGFRWVCMCLDDWDIVQERAETGQAGCPSRRKG